MTEIEDSKRFLLIKTNIFYVCQGRDSVLSRLVREATPTLILLEKPVLEKVLTNSSTRTDVVKKFLNSLLPVLSIIRDANLETLFCNGASQAIGVSTKISQISIDLSTQSRHRTCSLTESYVGGHGPSYKWTILLRERLTAKHVQDLYNMEVAVAPIFTAAYINLLKKRRDIPSLRNYVFVHLNRIVLSSASERRCAVNFYLVFSKKKCILVRM